MFYLLGIIAGLAAGVVILLLAIKIVRRVTHKKGTKPKYDERQQAARGKGFKYAYFTMLGMTTAAVCWCGSIEGTDYTFPASKVLLGILLAGVLVYASYAIWTDAYIAPNETYRSSVILMAVIAAINLAVGFVNLTVNNGSIAVINFGIGGMVAVICLEMIAKNLCDRLRRVDDEE